MKYRKLTVRSETDPDTCYRVLSVRDNLGLLETVSAVLVLFHMPSARDFILQTGSGTVYALIRKESELGSTLSLDGHTIADMPRRFTLTVDPDDPWVFSCHLSGNPKEIHEVYNVRALDGMGELLWDELWDDADRDLMEHENLDFNAEAENRVLEEETEEWTTVYRQEMDDNLNKPVYPEWDSLEEILEDAEEEEADWMDVWNILEANLKHRKAQKPLPASLAALSEEAGVTMDLPVILEEITDSLYLNEDYEDALNTVHRIREYFPEDRQLAKDLYFTEVQSYIHLGKVREAEAAVTQWLKEDPDSYAAKAAMISWCRTAEDYERGDRCVQEFFDPEEECDEDTAVLYREVIDYLRRTGDTERAEELNAVFEKWCDRMDAELAFRDLDEEEMPAFGEILGQMIDRYTEMPEDEEFSDVLFAICMTVLSKTPVFPCIRLNEEGEAEEALTVSDEDEDDYVVVYSCEDTAQRNGYTPEISIPLAELLDSVEENGCAGIVIDPIGEDVRFMITLDMIREGLSAMAETLDPDEDGMMS